MNRCAIIALSMLIELGIQVKIAENLID